MRRRRRASRIGSPAGAQARAQRPPHVDALPVARLLVAARAPQRGCELEARHQPVELRELVRLERVEALAPQQLLVARHRQRHLDLGRRPRPRRARRAATTTRSRPDRARPRRDGAAVRSERRPLVRRRRDRARVLGLELVAPSRVRRTPRRTRVEDVELRRVGHEHGAGRPVQPPARDRPHERERPREVGRALGRDRHAAVVQPPAQRRRRAAAGRARSSRRREARQSPLRTSCVEAGRADHLLVLARTSAPTRA